MTTANSVITKDNSSLSSMATGQLFDLFSLEEPEDASNENENKDQKSNGGVKAFLDNLPELWDDSQYSSEYDMDAYSNN